MNLTRGMQFHGKLHNFVSEAIRTSKENSFNVSFSGQVISHHKLLLDETDRCDACLFEQTGVTPV